MLTPILKILFKNRRQPWTKASDFHAAWNSRIKLMATYIEPGEVVLDFGCGPMWLEDHLKTISCTYIPIDFVKRDNRTIVCDFNKGQFPEISDGVAFLSGVLEYIKDLNTFIKTLKSQNYERIIFSYCTIEKIKNMKERHSLNWQNHESIFSLIQKFFPEYCLIRLNNEIIGNTIFVFQKIPNEHLHF